MTQVVFCLLALVNLALLSSADSSKSTIPPVGDRPILDGTMSPEEWSDSVRLEFIGGEGVYLKRDAAYLYVGLRGKQPGFASLCFATDDSVRVLHSSTATITATYARLDSSSWKLVRGFDSVDGSWDPGARRRGKQLSQMEADRLKQQHLARFHWLASTVSLGTPNEMEYQIALSSLDRKGTHFSVVYYQHQASERFARSPRGLSDGSMNQELVRGGTPGSLRFSPEVWNTVTW